MTGRPRVNRKMHLIHSYEDCKSRLDARGPMLSFDHAHSRKGSVEAPSAPVRRVWLLRPIG